MTTTSLLIDYTSIIKKYSLYLDLFTGTVVKRLNGSTGGGAPVSLNLPYNKSKHFSIGICLIIPKIQLEYLDTLQNGINKIRYINNISFINSISTIFYILYSRKDNICELHNIGNNDLNNLDLLLYSLIDSLPPKTIIWSRVEGENNKEVRLNKFIDLGFHSSFMCNKSPLNKIKYQNYGLCMYRKNNENETDFPKSSVKKEIKNTLESYTQNKCKLNIKFNTDTLLFLRKLCKTGKYLKNGKFVQKEIAGSLLLKLNEPTGNEGHYYDIIVRKDNLIVGKNEEVSISNSRYNFHSHPEQAYIRHKVSDGHPSGQDFLGYFQAIKIYGTVFHCVISLEGIYIISLQEYWCYNNIYKLSENSIEKKYDIPHNSLKHKSYMKKVNNISYKKNPLFNVSFLEWDTDDCDKIFHIFSPKIGNNCLISDESYKLYKKFFL